MDTFFDLAEHEHGIARLTLNRPERMNTLAPPFFPALRDAVTALNAAGRTRVLVVASTGRHFSAGMALDVFDGRRPDSSPLDPDSAASEGRSRSDPGGLVTMLDTGDARRRLAFQDHLRQLMRCFDVLEEARFPVVAAIQGACVGGALDLACACDIRVASADAFFAVQEIHIGMAADLGVLQRLPKIVSPALAREMAFTGDRIGAERALAAGLVNAVRPDAAAALDHALDIAARIAAKSPLAVAGSKLALNYAVDHPTADALQQMALLQSAIFDIDEMSAAIAAWKSKSAARHDPLAAVTPV